MMQRCGHCTDTGIHACLQTLHMQQALRLYCLQSALLTWQTLQRCMYRKLGFSKDETSPEVDLEDPHDYTIMSKAVPARAGS